MLLVFYNPVQGEKSGTGHLVMDEVLMVPKCYGLNCALPQIHT